MIVEETPHPQDRSSESSQDCAEIVFAFVAPLGAKLSVVENAVAERVKTMGYGVSTVHVTHDVLPQLDPKTPVLTRAAYERIGTLMDIGTNSRLKFGTDIVANGVAAVISKRRPSGCCRPKTAYIVHSLKHPHEVRRLREIYPRGFYLIAMNVPPDIRMAHLMTKYEFTKDEAEELMQRDKLESVKHGQRVNETVHLADFFVGWADDEDRIINSVYRFVDIVFGDPHRTPTFGEYAMFMAFSASLRSADLSRQVGAVIAKEGEILSTGANDCPHIGGGLYWPVYDEQTKSFIDVGKGRDYVRGVDSNRKAQLDIIKEITTACGKITNNGEILPSAIIDQIEIIIEESAIGSLTEFGRVVHAEMEALLSCARKGTSTRGATIYSTTFPCHNCAKHIIAAGIKRVVFIEPYLKSKASVFHDEMIKVTYPKPAGEPIDDSTLPFETFFGVGPRRFFDLFSMNLGSGGEIIRKDKDTGKVASWVDKKPRIKMNLANYIESEGQAALVFDRAVDAENAV